MAKILFSIHVFIKHFHSSLSPTIILNDSNQPKFLMTNYCCYPSIDDDDDVGVK